MPLTDEDIVGLSDAIAQVLGVEDDAAVKLRARGQVQVLNRQIYAYTRGNGYDLAGRPNEDICSVIVSAGARWVSNPAMSQSESTTAPLVRAYAAAAVPGETPALGSDAVMGSESFSFSGSVEFTPLELKILHAYRVRYG